MAAVRDPLTRVSGVRTRREANHLAGELRYSLENEQLTGGERHEHEEALSLLEDQFLSPPKRTSRPRAAHAQGRRRRGTPSASPTRAAPASAPRTSRARRAAGRLAAAAPTREAATVGGAAQTLAAPLTDSATDVMLGAARAGLLLALLYLILSNRGSRGLSGVLNAFTGITTAFFSATGDPLAALNGGGAMPVYPVGLTTPVTRANDPTADPSGRPQDIAPLVPRKPVTRRSH